MCPILCNLYSSRMIKYQNVATLWIVKLSLLLLCPLPTLSHIFLEFKRRFFWHSCPRNGKLKTNGVDKVPPFKMNVLFFFFRFQTYPGKIETGIRNKNIFLVLLSIPSNWKQFSRAQNFDSIPLSHLIFYSWGFFLPEQSKAGLQKLQVLLFATLAQGF